MDQEPLHSYFPSFQVLPSFGCLSLCFLIVASADVATIAYASTSRPRELRRAPWARILSPAGVELNAAHSTHLHDENVVVAQKLVRLPESQVLLCPSLPNLPLQTFARFSKLLGHPLLKPPQRQSVPEQFLLFIIVHVLFLFLLFVFFSG